MRREAEKEGKEERKGGGWIGGKREKDGGGRMEGEGWREKDGGGRKGRVVIGERMEGGQVEYKKKKRDN
ncbi:hypothetical protein Pmani_027173 [Petrolisthes manimaculis]|uniref:Uncharacterized protein n=1 Tax=Petrolisthes manimaculis TaxID=1843537 RepID=A0AAE1P4E4_9EUCA|nr:hypothetical protein Pmani_027173 [Petrolisthes manimaculis]